MSMRIITPLGKLCVVKKAVPLVSKQFEFNSSDRFLCEVCKEEGIANGIALDIGDKDSYGLIRLSILYIVWNLLPIVSRILIRMMK